MKKGYVSLHRQVLNSSLWSLKPESFKVFALILLKVNFKEYEGVFNDSIVHLQPGQLITSVEKLKHEAGPGLTTAKIKTALKQLTKLNIVTIKTTKRYTLVTLINWAKFQDSTPNVAKQTTIKRQTDDKQTTNRQQQYNNDINDIKVNNEKNVFIAPTKKEIFFYSLKKLYKIYSPKLCEVAANNFYNHYEAQDWKVGNQNRLTNWKRKFDNFKHNIEITNSDLYYEFNETKIKEVELLEKGGKFYTIDRDFIFQPFEFENQKYVIYSDGIVCHSPAIDNERVFMEYLREACDHNRVKVYNKEDYIEREKKQFSSSSPGTKREYNSNANIPLI